MPEKQAFQHFFNLLGFIIVYSKWCKNGVQIMHRMHKMQKSDACAIRTELAGIVDLTVQASRQENTKIGKHDHRKVNAKNQEEHMTLGIVKTITLIQGSGSDYIIVEI